MVRHGEPNPFDSDAEIAKRDGYALPHWTRVGAIYHTVFRQADALPASKLEEFRAEQERLLSKSELSPGDRERLKYFASDRAQAYLDAGHGSCFMKRPEVAQIVSQTLGYFDGQRYKLHAYAVMPNHVHVIIEPDAVFSLEKILHSWKSSNT